MDLLCTNKLTQGKCQRIVKFCCSGGKTKIMFPYFCIRSGDEWLVEKEGDLFLKASEANSFLPPTTSWLLYNGEDEDEEDEDKVDKHEEDFEEDPSLICSLLSHSPPCCLTVTLSGAAKEAHGDCEGEYKSTGLISMGRKV